MVAFLIIFNKSGVNILGLLFLLLLFSVFIFFVYRPPWPPLYIIRLLDEDLESCRSSYLE
jgi:hypothetical protein